MVVATQWVSHITAVSLEMVLPALLGYWLDQRWKTDPWLVCIGALLGFIVGMKHLLQLTSQAENSQKSKNAKPKS